MPPPRSCAHCRAPLPDPVTPGDACPSCGSQVEADTPRAAATGVSAAPVPAAPPPAFDTPAGQPGDPFAVTGSLSPGDAPTAVHDPTRPRLPARVPALAGYELQQQIGAGGMGAVYRAVQTRAGRTVAVKVIQAFGGVPPHLRARFDTEAKALGRLTHPNIVPVYEVGEADGTPFFSMEHVPGGTLADRVKDGSRVPAAEAAGLIAAVAAAVDAAHRVGVLHRDLKPGNVLLAADGAPKVADFGLAKFLDRDDGPTHTGSALGTPSYMAPEQAGGKSADVGPHTDVYGLGATLYHLLTGRPPFREETPMGTALRVATEEPPAPREVCPDLDPVLEAVVRKAMARDPADRYPSAAALAADLTAWQKGEPTVARPLTRRQKLRRWARRHRAKLAAAVLLPLAVVAVAVARREADPKRRIERALARGEAVTLLGETGLPRWHRWELNEVALTQPADAGGAAGFQSQVRSLLELVPDTGSDHYRLTAEVRHLSGRDADARVGVYLGPTTAWGPGGERVGRWHGFEFTEFPAPVVKRPGLNWVDWLTVHYPHAADSSNVFGTPVFEFPPARDEPTPWRQIVIDVSPAAVAVYWRRADGSRAEAFRRPGGADPAAVLFRKRFDPTGIGQGPPVPAWSPRGPAGVYAVKAGIAFRNVSIVPSPSDPLP